MVMADKVTIKMQPDISQLRGLLKALNQMDDDSKKALKEDVASISAWTANGIRMAGYVGSPMPAQTAIVAQTVRGNKDRIPNVTIGGSRGRASGGAKAGILLFGNEFGSDRNTFGSAGNFPNGGYKFPARTPGQGRGNRGYWIFPTLKAMQPEITRRWKNSVEKVLDNWNKGSGGGLG
jgi:hypothetical protein